MYCIQQLIFHSRIYIALSISIEEIDIVLNNLYCIQQLIFHSRIYIALSISIEEIDIVLNNLYCIQQLIFHSRIYIALSISIEEIEDFFFGIRLHQLKQKILLIFLFNFSVPVIKCLKPISITTISWQTTGQLC